MTSVNRPLEQLEGTLCEPDFQKLIDSNLCTVYEHFDDLDYPGWLKSELHEFLNPLPPRQGWYTKLDEPFLIVYFLRLPVQSTSGAKRALIRHVLGEAPDYQAVCQSRGGTVTWLQEAFSFCFQTPEDDTGLSYSFGATTNNKGAVRCVLVSPDSAEEILCSPKYFQSRYWRSDMKQLALLLIPLRVLQAHVAYTSSALAGLTDQISKAEAWILDPSQLKDFDIFIKNLHRCNADLLKLERRWRFERNLSATIRGVIEAWKHDLENRDKTRKADKESIYLLHPLAHETMKMDDASMLQERLSQASEYDLGVLPRRIQNQFTAVYNLMAQRDTKATIRLAMDSQRLGTASLRDSSSMKTIAGMTLIFLPPTFICSFFSMSFFSFEETGAKSIWIYFATAAPLTALVTLSWIVYTSWRRKADERRFEQKASSAHAV